MFTLYENYHEPVPVYESAWVLVTVLRFVYPDEGEPRLAPHAIGEAPDYAGTTSSTDDGIGGLSIDDEESAVTFTASFDPHSTYTIPSLSALVPLLSASQKWLLARPLKALRAMLVHPHFLATEPLRIFAIATRFEFDEEARIASEWVLRTGALGVGMELGLWPDGAEADEVKELEFKDGIPEELKWVTAFAFWELQRLHRRRVNAACEILRWPETYPLSSAPIAPFANNPGHFPSFISSTISTSTSTQPSTSRFDPTAGPLIPPTCMQCSARGFGSLSHATPRWWEEWRSKAIVELRKRPVSQESGIFEMKFLFGCAKRSGCVRCCESVLGSWAYLEGVRARIDALDGRISL